VAANSEDFMIFSLRRFNTIQQCDRQTDGQTPRPCLKRVTHSAIASKKTDHIALFKTWTA